MNKRNIKTGMWIRSQWDDTGAEDGIVVEKHDDYVTMYSVGGSRTMSVAFEQIVDSNPTSATRACLKAYLKRDFKHALVAEVGFEPTISTL